MFWIMVLGLVLGFVFFKLGVYWVLLGIAQLLGKVLFVVSGAFLVVGAWRYFVRRRQTQVVRIGRG